MKKQYPLDWESSPNLGIWIECRNGTHALWGDETWPKRFNSLTIIGRLQGGFEAALTGWITDKYGPRWIVIFGVFLMGLGLILMNFIDSLWSFYIVWGITVGTGVNIALSLPMDKAISNWFVKKRGLALGIRWVLLGLAQVLVLPMVAWLTSTQGWRTTCVIGGLVMWIIGLPLAWFFIKRHRPEYYGLLPDGAKDEEGIVDTRRMIDRGVEYAAEVQEIEFTLRQAMKTSTYWLLMLANTADSMVIPVILVHSIPFLTDMGIEPVKAAVMIATIGIIGIPARFLGGLLADRIKKEQIRFLIGGAYLLQAIGITVFLLNQTIPSVYVFYVCHTIAFGVSFTLNAMIRARYFGRKAFGSIAGVSRVIMTPVGVAAPIYTGWVYDTTGSYITAFTLLAILLALAAVTRWYRIQSQLQQLYSSLPK